ncbi:hypothetical protein XAPC_3888 [Xanthomonas citri pv. punicae str. LMG 859]|nr:hypothetical protein XAPC_3888 [Xanthomonas citri pv. punicae str. LMG 859]
MDDWRARPDRLHGTRPQLAAADHRGLRYKAKPPSLPALFVPGWAQLVTAGRAFRP